MHDSTIDLPLRGRLGDVLSNWDNDQTMRALGLLVGLVVAHRISLIIYNLWFHPLSAFPGPKHMAMSYLPFSWENHVRGRMVFRALPLHLKYGPIVRVGPNHLMVEGNIAYPRVLARQTNGPEFEKIRDFGFPGDWLGLGGAPKEEHRRLRHQLAPAFSDSTLKGQVDVFNKYFDQLFTKFDQFAQEGTLADIVYWMNCAAFDILGELTVGEPFYCLDKDKCHPWVLSIFEGLRGLAIYRFCLSYPIFGIFFRVFRIFAETETSKKNQAIGGELVLQRVARGETAGRRDFTSYMTGHDGKPGFSKDELVVTSAALFIAGAETSATTLSGLVFYLCNTPEAHQLLVKEIRESFASESDIDLIALAKMPYLQACIEESMRIYASVGEHPWRCSPGATLSGKWVPQGTYITTYSYANFRHPENFALPEEYHPERWLPKSHELYDDRFKDDNKAVFKPFSVGPRDCLGKNMAYTELRLIVSRLLWRYDISLAPGQEKWQESQRAFLLWDKGPLNIQLKKRQH